MFYFWFQLQVIDIREPPHSAFSLTTFVEIGVLMAQLHDLSEV